MAGKSDRAYWGTCSSQNLLTASIPFHDCDEARGSLVVLDKSDRWSNLQDMRHFNDPDLSDLTDKFQVAGKKVVKVPITLKDDLLQFRGKSVIDAPAVGDWVTGRLKDF